MVTAESSKAAANNGIKPNINGSAAAAHDLPWYTSSANADCPQAHIYAGSKNIDHTTLTT